MPSIVFSEPDMSYYNDSSDDSIRRLTDEYGRHRLTDLLEADENEEDGLECLRSPSRRKRYSSIGSTASSMDGLWESHPRRLSEAGLSRHSDSSAVLTEDTDSFMIGQRVWVGGTKPGTIAYIGETQFAPGDWAGIALDEPIGKNDGSVAGTRYFQCENKKGVFSRLTRLTRVPLEQTSETCISPNGVRRGPISPTGSTKSLLKSPTLSNSNTSLSSAHVDFKIGDRVIIKSTQGSKVGTVRYMGLTDFAPGDWVGVELDDPRGKNDGSVEGRRYFECRPHFGLFAPMHKVSKSPSKVKPGACVVHSGVGLPPSGLKRTNSKESLTSMTSMTSRTSAASSVRRVRLGVTSLTPKKVQPKTTTPIPTRTALQDVLREKQQHIEQLLKERDLERAEITRAASQADEAEHRFFGLKQEFEHYRSECEAKVRESSELLSRLKVDREDLLTQLEDEKRRNEDLQFRFEEAAITKTDIEATNENNVKKIRDLEQSLIDERTKAENAEGISNRLFEAEENLIKAREEIDSLKNELEETKKMRRIVEDEKSASADLLSSLQKQIQQVTTENEEKEITINTLNENISKLNIEQEQIKQEIQENCLKKDSEIESLKKMIVENDDSLKEKLSSVEKLTTQVNELTKENDKLKMELSAKSLDLETTVEKLSAMEENIKSAQKTFEEEKQQLSQQIKDLESHKSNLTNMEDSQRKELKEVHEKLKSKVSEIEQVKKELSDRVAEKERAFEEINKKSLEDQGKIEKLHAELAEVKNKYEQSEADVHSRHTRQILDQESQLMALSKELHQKSEEITKNAIVINKLEDDICTKNGIIEQLQIQLESFKSQHSNLNEKSSDMAKTIQDLELNTGDLQRQLTSALDRIDVLSKAKENLENEIQQIIATSGQENASQLEQLTKEVHAKEKTMEAMRVELTEKLQLAERARHEVELQYQQLSTDLNKVKEEYEKKLQIASQTEASLKERCDSSIEETSKTRDEFRLKIGDLEQTLREKELLLTGLQSKLVQNENDFQRQIKQVTEESTGNLQSHRQKVDDLTNEILQLKDQLTRKTEEVTELDAKCNHISVRSQQTENELQEKHNERVRTLEFELNEKNAQLETRTNELNLLKGDCQNVNVDLTAKNRRISELTAELEATRQVVNKLEGELGTARSAEQQVTQERLQQQNQCQGLLEQVARLTEKVKVGDTTFNNLQIEHNNVLHLIKRLQITEQQKQQCLQQIQQEAESGENKNCSQVIQLLNQVQIVSNQNSQKVASLQQEVDFSKNKLEECNRQFEMQRGEILRLQNELLKAQETTLKSTGETGDQISVSSNTATQDTTHNTQHDFVPHSSLELQVQLTLLKKSFNNLSVQYETLQKTVISLLRRLQAALNTNDNVAVNNIIRRFLNYEYHFDNFKNTMSGDNFNLLRTLQYAVIQLQQKDQVIQDHANRVRYLQQIVQGLPMQCKGFLAPPENLTAPNDCEDRAINIRKLESLLFIKEQRILQLQQQVSSVLIECNNARSQIEINSKIQVPSANYMKSIVPTPPKIVRVLVPVPQPTVVVKKIYVPQINGVRCPPPTIQQVKVPQMVIHKIPFPVSVPTKCLLPDLSPSGDVLNSSFDKYAPSEVSKFKRTIQNLVTLQVNRARLNFKCPPITDCKPVIQQIPMVKNVPVRIPCPQLPSTKVPMCQPCPLAVPVAVTRTIIKEKPIRMPWNCNHHQESVKHEEVYQNEQREETETPRVIVKEVPIKVPVPIPEKIYVKQIVEVPKVILRTVKVPVVVPTMTCQPQPPRIVIKQIPVMVPQVKIVTKPVPVHCPEAKFKTIIKERPVFVPGPPRVVIKETPVRIPVPIKVPVRIPVEVPVQVPVKVLVTKYIRVPKIIVEKVNVPVKVPEFVFVPQPAKILVKQVPVPVPQPPRVIIKHVPINVDKYRTRVVIKEKPIPIQLPPRIIVKEVPVRIRVPVKIQERVVVNVPVKVPVPVQVPVRVPMECHLPDINVAGCVELQNQIDSLVLSGFSSWEVLRFKQNLLTVLLQQRLCRAKEQIISSSKVNNEHSINREIVQPVINEKVVIKEKMIPSPPQIIVKQVPVRVPVYISQPPKIIVKQVPTPCVQQQPRVIIKEKRVLVSSPPRVITKEVPVEIQVPVPHPVKVVVKEYVKVPVPVPVPQPPKIFRKEVPVYIPQPPKIIIKQVLVPCNQQKTFINKQESHVNVNEKSMSVPSPPKIIIKEVPIRVRVPVPYPVKVVVKDYVKVPVTVPVLQPPKVITKEVPVYVPQPPKVIIKQVLIPCNQQKSSVIVENKSLHQQEYQLSPSKTVIKEKPIRIRVPVPYPIRVPVKEYVKVPVTVPVLQPPKVITKEIPVYIPQPPKIIFKQIPCTEQLNQQSDAMRLTHEAPIRVKVPVPYPVRVVVKEFVKVPVLQPPRLITKEVPIYIPQAPKIIVKQISIPCVQQQPKIIIKENRVLVPSPPRIITKSVPVRVQVPYPVKVVVKEFVKVPVPVPVPQPPKVIRKEFPIYIPQPPRIIVKQVPCNQQDNRQSKVIVKEKSVFVPSPPKIITKEVPIRVKVPVPYPVKVPMPVRILQPPKVITREVPVYIPQAPKIIFKQVPCEQHPLPPRIITKEVLVPGPPQPPKIVVQRVPVKVPVVIPCHLPLIDVNRNTDIFSQIESLTLSDYDTSETQQYKKNLILLLTKVANMKCEQSAHKEKIYVPHIVQVPVPMPPKIVFQKIPVIVEKFVERPAFQSSSLGHLRKVSSDALIKSAGPVLNVPPRIILRQVPIAVPSPPKIILKRVPVYVEKRIMLPAKVIVREVPVRVPTFIKVPIRVPVKEYIKIPIPVSVPQPPRVFIKEVPIYIPQPPKVIFKEKPCDMRNANVVVREKPVLVPSPPRVITKEIPVRIRVPVPYPVKVVVTKPVKVPVTVPVPQPPQIIMQQVPVKVPVLIPVPCREKCYLPDFRTNKDMDITSQIESISLPNCNSLEVQQFKKNLLSVASNMANYERSLLAKESVSQVQVKEVPQSPQILIKEVPVMTSCDKPNIVIREKPVFIPSPLQNGMKCHLPNIKMDSSSSIQEQIRSLVVPSVDHEEVAAFKENILSMLQSGSNCPSPTVDRVVPPPKIIEKPIFVPSPPRIIMRQIGPTVNGKVCPPPLVVRIPIKSPSVRGSKFLNTNQWSVLSNGNDCRRVLNTLKSELLVYRRILNQLRTKVSSLQYSKNVGFRVPSNALPAVPIPMMHIMNSVNKPSVPLKPFQHVSSPLLSRNEMFVESFLQKFYHTQEALSHCMDAIVAQKLTYSQINSKCNNCHQLIQDRELADNQIKFLNSIIVDIQKKNEEQQQRIAILESGYSPAAADELKEMGMPQRRQLPPRVYCDICEEFDLHETEDCPQQNSDVAPSQSSRGHKPREERPYCEICEAFGHATEDCQEDQTF